MAGPVSVAPWGAAKAPVVAAGSGFARLWRGFANARVAIAATVLVLVSALSTVLPPGPKQIGLLAFCAAYLAATLMVRLFVRTPGRDFDLRWLATIGLDLIAFSALEYLQAGGINFAPLFAVPVLMASVLGAAPLAFGTAAAVTLLLLVDAWVHTASFPPDQTQRFLQAGLTGLGYFALAALANQLSDRLAREEARARESAEAARLQGQVNELVIETLSDGVLVVDAAGRVRAANPTAGALLGRTGVLPGFLLSADPGLRPLLSLAQHTMEAQANQMRELSLGAGEAQRRLLVRTRLAAVDREGAASLCVVFLEDLREMEARLRTEKLAAMGRMSAAVAHEIRNPLAAIAQANALLDEELTDPAQRQLSAMVRQNAQRLARIVEEVLDVARVQQQGAAASAPLPLEPAVGHVCRDWARQTQNESRLRLGLPASRAQVLFEGEHLRRVLVNLLDNAARHAGHEADSIQVAVSVTGPQVSLRVWSDGAPLEPTVRLHLFEPFFSSESRSSGLGLYICRELCERHGAQIGYRRCTAPLGASREGNEFFVNIRPAASRLADGGSPARIQA